MSQEFSSNVARGQVIPVEAPQVTEPEAPVLSELEQRLQAAMSPKEETVAAQGSEALQQPIEASPQTVAEPKYSEEEQAKFREMFELQFGVAPEAFKEQVQSFTQERQQAQQLNELNALQTEWGVPREEVAKRLDLISQKMQTLPPETQRGLDNAAGIRLLWSAIATEASTKVPPRFDKSTISGATQKPGTFTRAEINAMDNATYARNIKAIEYAYANGLVIN